MCVSRCVRSSGFCGIILLFCVAVCCSTLVAATDPISRSVGPALPAKSHASLLKGLVNPHLHGAVPTAKTPAPPSKTAPTKTRSSRARLRYLPRWSYSNWVVLHRGLGTIRGEVLNSKDAVASGVHVELRSSKGKKLRVSRRHVTHTTAGGTFVMRHVRIGNYHVRASKGKASGHVSVQVRGGTLSTALVKI